MAANAKSVFSSERVTSLANVGFDEDRWGVGVSGVVAAPSPFARINKLRDWYLDGSPWTVDAERAVLVTEAYRCSEHEPQPIKVAKALAHVLRNVTLGIVDGQLLVGDAAAPPKACPIFPEFSFSWITKELKEFPIRDRPNNRYDYDDQTEATLLGLADYWQGRTLSDAMIGRMSPEEMKGDFMGIMLYSTSLYHVAGVGHLVPDFERILRLGWRGMRQQVKAKATVSRKSGRSTGLSSSRSTRRRITSVDIRRSPASRPHPPRGSDVTNCGRSPRTATGSPRTRRVISGRRCSLCTSRGAS
jgi:hypothetical protein